MPKTIILGVSGRSASGKDSVCAILTRLAPRAKVFTADEVAHRLYRRGSAVWKKLVQHFGQSILTPSRAIDRKRLGEIVFQNPRELAILNRLTHPLIRRALRSELGRARRQGIPLVILNAALLHTIPLHDLVDFSWVVAAPEKVRLLRLIREKRLDRQAAEQRIRAQRRISFRCPQDILLKNTGRRTHLARQVRRAYNKMMARWNASA